MLRDESTTSGSRWQITFKRLFDLTDDSDLFRTREALEVVGWELDGNVFVRNGKRMLPLYEGKMVHHFDHRWNSYYGTDDDRRHLTLSEKQDPAATAMPRYWIAESGTFTTVRRNREVEVPGVATGWLPRSGTATGSSAGAMCAAPPTNVPRLRPLSPARLSGTPCRSCWSGTLPRWWPGWWRRRVRWCSTSWHARRSAGHTCP